MTEPGSLQERLIAARERYDNLEVEIQRRPDLDPDEMFALIEQSAREYHRCALAAGDPNEIMKSLVVLCATISERHPSEAIDLAEQFYQHPAKDDARADSIADALHIAYKAQGEAVRAQQQRARAIRLRREYAELHGSDLVTFPGLMSALRSAATPLADSRAFTIDPNTPPILVDDKYTA